MGLIPHSIGDVSALNQMLFSGVFLLPAHDLSLSVLICCGLFTTAFCVLLHQYMMLCLLNHAAGFVYTFLTLHYSCTGSFSYIWNLIQ